MGFLCLTHGLPGIGEEARGLAREKVLLRDTVIQTPGDLLLRAFPLSGELGDVSPACFSCSLLGGPDFICRMPGWGEKTNEHSHQLALGGTPAPFLALFARLLTHHTLHI